MSHYYEYLIYRSLDNTGKVEKDEYGTIFNYLSNLSWYFVEKALDSITLSDFEKFNSYFSAEYTDVNYSRISRILFQANIITEDNSDVSFTYPYLRYFFIGKYLSDNYNSTDVSKYIDNCIEKIFTREFSNSILFMCHHNANREDLLERLCDTLNECFNDNQPILFGDEIQYLDDLKGAINSIIVEDFDIEENNKDRRNKQDDVVEVEDSELIVASEKSRIDNTKDEGVSIYRTIRAAEVLGQITKNNYGIINRSGKKRNIKSVINVFFRMLGLIFEKTKDIDSRIRNEINLRLSEKDEISLENSDLIENISKKIMVDMVSLITFSIVAKTSDIISSDKIISDIYKICYEDEDTKDNKAYKLILAASYLMSPGNINIGELRKIYKDLESSHMAMDTFQKLALYHIYMFDTPHKQKHKLGDLMHIDLKKVAAKKIISKIDR